MTPLLISLLACAPGQGVLVDPLVGDTAASTVPTPTNPADTDTDTDVDTDTDTDVDTDTATTPPTGTADTVDTALPLPCDDGVCRWTLLLEETLPPGRRRGAIGAAVGPAGVVHVLVHDPDQARLLYLRSDSKAAEVVGDGAGDAEATELSVAVDVDGRVHVATLAGNSYRLIAREPDGTWNQQPLAGRTDVVSTAAVSRRGDTWMGAGRDAYVWNGGGYTAKPALPEVVEAMALDATGTVHALMGTGGPEPLYTRYDGAAWGARVAIYSGTFERTRLALDDDDVAHAVIEVDNPPGSDLLYAQTSSGSWAVDALAVGGTAHASGLALDAAGRPHVSYHDGVGTLQHGWFDGTGWVRSDVAACGEVQETIPMIDPLTDAPVVVTYDVDADALRIYRGE
jgi:hypothetical protein